MSWKFSLAEAKVTTQGRVERRLLYTASAIRGLGGAQRGEKARTARSARNNLILAVPSI